MSGRNLSRPRFRLAPEDPLEVDIHEQCARVLDRVLAPPAMWCCYPAGGTELSQQQWARYARMGLKRGMPDLFVFYAGLWGIELKRRGGQLSKTRVVRTKRGTSRVLTGQEEVFPALLRSGGFRDIAVAHSVEEVLDQLDRWQIPLRGRIAA
jgi:hypothetical protein